MVSLLLWLLVAGTVVRKRKEKEKKVNTPP